MAMEPLVIETRGSSGSGKKPSKNSSGDSNHQKAKAIVAGIALLIGVVLILWSQGVFAGGPERAADGDEIITPEQAQEIIERERQDYQREESVIWGQQPRTPGSP